MNSIFVEESDIAILLGVKIDLKLAFIAAFVVMPMHDKESENFSR